MSHTRLAACILSAALMSAPAFAQTSTTPNPATTAPAGSTPGMSQSTTAGAMQGTFVTQREPGIIRASELIGTDVRGANNEDIGEVGDVLIDRSGQVRAVVVDIGGFLGIGETHVAIPMQSVQMRSNQNANTTGSVGGMSGAAGTTAGTTTTQQGAAGQNTAARTNNQPAAGGSDAGTPTVIVVMMTKEQLQNAPKFQDNNRGGASGTGTTAPRQ